MGCSSSVQVAEPLEETNEKIPVIEKPSNDSTSNYSGLGIVNAVLDDDYRRLSVLTVKSGNVRFNRVSENDSPLTITRDLATIQSANAANSPEHPFDTCSAAINSPPLNRKPYLYHINGPNSPGPPRARNPLTDPRSYRYSSLSLPTSPLVRVKERPELESAGRSLVDVRSEKDPSINVEETQKRLSKALRELSRSLSDSHGSIFHLDSEDANHRHSPPASVASVSPDMTRLSGSSGDVQPNLHGNAVVINIGSGFCKAGFANDDVPSVVMHTLIGRPSNADALPGVAMDTLFMGNDAKLRKNVLNLTRPVQRGVVQDWDDWTSMVDHVIKMELKMDQEEISCVLPESALSTRGSREKQAELMFEKLQLSKLFQGSSSPMALHAFGMTSGLLVSVGHDVTSCVPVIQGNVLSKGIRSLQVGGSDITRKLQKLIEADGKNGVKNGKDDSIAKAMMERLCYVTIGAADDDDTIINRTKRIYSLPTGVAVSLDKERFMAPEILFNPDVLEGHHQPIRGIHKMCVESVDACRDDCDVTNDLYKNVVLVGGTSLLPGLSQRLKREIFTLVPHLPADDITVHALPKRQYAVWRGAAHMTSLHSSRCRWMTKAEYDEHGPPIVHRKYV